ncbi:MAG: hypothetical protein M3426_08185 [Actinomycetota bacterium]|nr:hypothetical protein [Actinomycetota bacterium]
MRRAQVRFSVTYLCTGRLHAEEIEQQGTQHRDGPSPAAHATLRGMDGGTRTLEDVIRELDGGLLRVNVHEEGMSEADGDEGID